MLFDCEWFKGKKNGEMVASVQNVFLGFAGFLNMHNLHGTSRAP